MVFNGIEDLTLKPGRGCKVHCNMLALCYKTYTWNIHKVNTNTENVLFVYEWQQQSPWWLLLLSRRNCGSGTRHRTRFSLRSGVCTCVSTTLVIICIFSWWSYSKTPGGPALCPPGNKESDLPAEYLNSPLAQQSQVRSVIISSAPQSKNAVCAF